MKNIQAPPAPELTADEQRMLAAFRTMDRRGRGEYVVLMEQTAAKYPERPAPRLQLVTGGAK